MSPQVKDYTKNIPKTISEIQDLLEDVRTLFKKEPNIIHISKTPCLFIGDTHGDFSASQKVVERFFKEENMKLIFLGDYVDRGAFQLENVLFLFLLKRDFPKKIILLRGNHEEEEMNYSYGFQSVLQQKFGREYSMIFAEFQNTFAHLPLSVLTWNHIFGVHGGIPISTKNEAIHLDEIAQLKRGAINLQDFDFITAQLLWNDPKEEIQGAVPSGRGIGFYFGSDKFQQFIDYNNIRVVIRSHEVFQKGYKYFFNKKLISIFSALNYVYLQGIHAKMVKLETDDTLEIINIAS